MGLYIKRFRETTQTPYFKKNVQSVGNFKKLNFSLIMKYGTKFGVSKLRGQRINL